MNISQLSYRKEQLLRFVFAFSLLLSIFSVSAPQALSGIQQQKAGTEFPWIQKDNISIRSLQYSTKQILNTSLNCSVTLSTSVLEAILIYNREQAVKFIHFTNLFNAIKMTLDIRFDFNNHLIIRDQSYII